MGKEQLSDAEVLQGTKGIFWDVELKDLFYGTLKEVNWLGYWAKESDVPYQYFKEISKMKTIAEELKSLIDSHPLLDKEVVKKLIESAPKDEVIVWMSQMGAILSFEDKSAIFFELKTEKIKVKVKQNFKLGW